MQILQGFLFIFLRSVILNFAVRSPHTRAQLCLFFQIEIKAEGGACLHSESLAGKGGYLHSKSLAGGGGCLHRAWQEEGAVCTVRAWQEERAVCKTLEASQM